MRKYRDVAGSDRSQLLEQVLEQRARVSRRLSAVEHVIAVMSGKGGVGKSYVTAGLALALTEHAGRAVGVLDADLHGPTVGRLLRVTGPLRMTDSAVEPAVGLAGVRVITSDLLIPDGRPLDLKGPSAERFVWRGAVEAGTVREFLSDVHWGRLDMLLIDLPPGAGLLADLHQLVPDITGVIAVTIPTGESERSVERTMRAAVDDGMTILGLVENMSGYECETCGTPQPLFPGSAGNVLSERFGVPLLGRIPFWPGAGSGATQRDGERAERSESFVSLAQRLIEVIP